MDETRLDVSGKTWSPEPGSTGTGRGWRIGGGGGTGTGMGVGCHERGKTKMRGFEMMQSANIK